MKCYVVDAFTDTVFKGNPAAVCILKKWISDSLMQDIAKENNLSETAFAVREGEQYSLRWFTPGGEIDLCGHATLASAYIIMNYIETHLGRVSFQTRSGLLTVKKTADLYEMDMPCYQLHQAAVTDEMEQAIGYRPVEAWMGRDLVCVMKCEEHVTEAHPDEEKTVQLDGLLLHITAKGREFDCVTRSFAPKLNVMEDPVCGSGHCHVIPLWAQKTGKNELCAYQASRRSGILYCKLNQGRVLISGKAVLYSMAELFVPED